MPALFINLLYIQDDPMPEINESENDCNNNLMLVSRKERVALLKNGLTGKDIESLYLRMNGIVVIGINWQDLKTL